MAYNKRLGVFVKIPESGSVKTRLVPPLSAGEAADLSLAFIRDFFERLSRLKKLQATVFFTGADSSIIEPYIPENFSMEPQKGENLGQKLKSAFSHMLKGESETAVIVGTDSPDMPLRYIKRAFFKLKHKDVVLGPCADGGYYLIGLKAAHEKLFESIHWSESTVFIETLRAVNDGGLSLSLMPLWYDVDDARTLALLRAMMLGKKIEKSGGLKATSQLLARITREKKL